MELIQQARSKTEFRFSPGDIACSNYVILECIAFNAKSAVYKCHHKDLKQPILALKILNPAYSSDPGVAARFHQEVVASYSVTHPNVVRTHEFIREGNLIAYTMEYMDCGSLKDYLQDEGVVELDQAITILSQLCQGLQAIHDAGIVHRHIKPGNIFFSSQGVVKVSDFGIARSDVGPKLTNDGEVLGTVGYASPEYLSSGNLDHRSDIYAIGMIGYEMITGTFPFATAHPVQSLKQRLTTDPRSPTEYRPECPLELSNIILRALARDPNRRYQSAGEMFSDLESLGVAASINSFTKPRRERKPSFLTKDVLQPFVELGAGLGEERVSRLNVVLDNLLDDAFRRRATFVAAIVAILVLQIVLVSVVIFGRSPKSKSLSEIPASSPSQAASQVSSQEVAETSEATESSAKPKVNTERDSAKKARESNKKSKSSKTKQSSPSVATSPPLEESSENGAANTESSEDSENVITDSN